MGAGVAIGASVVLTTLTVVSGLFGTSVLVTYTVLLPQAVSVNKIDVAIIIFFILYLSFQDKSSSRVGDMGPLTLYTIYVAPASLVEYWMLATTRAGSED